MVKIKHIMITAGGTAEAIDGVRKISNTSTGSLAACIYEALAEYIAEGLGASGKREPEFIVHYVVSETAVMPEENVNLPIKFYIVTDVESVESVLEKLLADYKIDYIIHSMAVSDFTKGYLIEQEELICELAETLEKALNDNEKSLSEEQLKEYIGNVLKNPKRILNASSKVSSKAELML
ncbi:MAG: hypothetical protein GX025_00070, partial [Clostridiales bacterium]|nr:hypothetical protein [Clostridiales bacterium]